MEICPRCKSPAEELQPIPPSTLPNDGGQTTEEQRLACSRCIHEILEG